MVNRSLLFALGMTVIVTLFVNLASAEIQTSVATTREVVTISTQAHPKKTELAYMVMEKLKIGEAAISYRLDRWNVGPVELQTGGRIICSLKLITESGTQTIGRQQKALCEAAIWEDEQGSFNQRVCDLYWERVDLDLEPGDVLLWTVRFKKMPNLEFESWEDTVYRDRFDLTASLHPPWD